MVPVYVYMRLNFFVKDEAFSYIVSHVTRVYTFPFVALLYGHTCCALSTTFFRSCSDKPRTLMSRCTRRPRSRSFMLPTSSTVDSTIESEGVDGIFMPMEAAEAFMADWKHAP